MSTVCDPAARPVKVLGEVSVVKPPPSICNWYGGVPPPKVAITEPSLAPKQLTSSFVRSSVTAVGVPTSIDFWIAQLLASLTSTVCEPAARPVKVLGEVSMAKPPPSIWNWYGAVPPPKVAITEPSLAPKQLTSCLVRSSVTELGVPTSIDFWIAHSCASFTSTVCDPAARPVKVLGEVAAAKP